MSSAKYLGYLSGAAVAAGVGAAIAVSGQGIAHADADGSSSSSSSPSKTESKADSKTDKATKAGARADRDSVKAVGSGSAGAGSTGTKGAGSEDSAEAGPKRTSGKPTFDPAAAVKELTRQFGTARPSKSEQSKDRTETDDTVVPGTGAPVTQLPETGLPETQTPDTNTSPVKPVETEPTAPEPVFQPISDLGTKASEAAAVLAKPLPPSARATSAAQADPDGPVAAGPVPWSPNPFRPMPPEPAPNDMPGVLWNLEQTVIRAFDGVPFLQPFVREGFEAAFRGSQMIPWVNAVIPVINIAGQLPNLNTGDPVLFRDATQRIINNLLVTIHPISVLYYGYDEIADLINLEYEAQQLKEGFYATTWNILDPFALLHNRGSSGLPMSPSSPSAGQPQEPGTTVAVKLAAAVGSTAGTDAPGSDPFRPNDPDPIGMPQPLIQARNFVMLILPSPVREIYREGFELVYRSSQMVPFVNVMVPVTRILPAVFQALSGNKAAAQIAVNQLLLTTGPISILYYGFDQIADLLNMEEAGFAAKQQFYADLWDSFDPNFLLHHQGQSGLRYA
ncbi:MAG: hypothetical protein WBB07_16435 [Mycobacterium sp.]